MNGTAKIAPAQHSKVYWALHDSWVSILRSLKLIFMSPDQLMGLVLMPLMFMLLFRYVFGGAINTGGITYVNFLIAGIIVQSAAFGATTTSFSLAIDLQRGVFDRFRSLPMSNAAVLMGHVVSDLVRNILSTIILVLVGFAVGFRPNASLGDWLLASAILLIFTFGISWLSAILALLVKSMEAVQMLSFVIVFPFTFASSAFAPTDSMPKYLKIFAENQPVTQVVDAIRALMVNLPVENHIWISFAWWTMISLISIVTAVVLFKRQSTR